MFKSIEGFENYEVNPQGLVRNVTTKRLLKPQETTHGYLTVGLYLSKGKSKHFRIHRLVAEAFIPKVLGKEHVNHKDGDKKNNNVNNLEWVDPIENDHHAKKILRKQSKPHGGYNGQYHSKARLFEVIDEQGKHQEAYGYSQLEQILGVSRSFIHKKIKKGEKISGFTIVEKPKPVKESQVLTAHLVVRLTEAEDIALKRLSELNKKPKSYFARLLLINLLKQENLL